MEFTLANFYVKDFLPLGSKYFYKGDVSLNDGLHVFYDGYIIGKDREDIASLYLNIEVEHDEKGLFNIVFFDSKNDLILIKNDKIGKIPLYLYSKGTDFIISNNVWEIMRIIGSPESLDKENLISQIFHASIPHETETLFHNIQRFPNATVAKSYKGGEFSFRRYYEFVYTPNEKLKIDEEANILNEEFVSLFSYIKKENPNGILGFGNSGGFDSRLIAYYAKEVGLPSIGYVIGQQRPNRILNSTTKFLSDKVAEYFDLSNKWIEYSSENLMDYLLLDIRNDPFFISQLFKNPINDVSFFDYEITGQPGSFPRGIPHTIQKGTKDDLIEHSLNSYSYIRGSLRGMKNTLYKGAKHLNIPYSYAYEDSYLSDFISEVKYKKSSERFKTFYNEHGGRCNYEAWERFYERVYVKYDYCGGYESFCRTKKTYFLYYPFFYERMKNWPQSFFVDRGILKEIFKQNSSFLSELPGQDLQPAGNQSIIKSLLKKLEMATRGRGLNFDYLLHSKKFKELASEILLRDNPLFDEIIGAKKILKSNLLYSYCGVNLVKLKLMIDIVYFGEYENLNREEFRYASWK